MSDAISSLGATPVPAAKLNRVVERVFLFLVVASGLMEATAVFNTATFGIPFFWATTALMLWALAAAFLRGERGVRLDRRVLALVFALLLLLGGLTLVQVLVGRVEASIALPQLVARTALASFFLILAVFLIWRQNFLPTLAVLAAFLAIYVGYGLFDFVGQIFGWPGFLNFLRNSVSYGAAEARGAQGWLRLPRVMSLASEPSTTTLLTTLALYAGFFLWPRRWFYGALIFATLVFSALTFSRSNWLTVGAATVAAGFATALVRFRPRLYRPIVWLGLAPVMIVLPLLYLISVSEISSVFSDSSAADRSATTLMGLRIFFDHPLLGVGLNNFEDQVWRYGGGLLDPLAKEIDLIANGPAFYLQAFGAWGLAFFYLPIIYVISLERLSPTARLWWVVALSVYGSTVDFYYLPQAWFVLALLTAENSHRSRLARLGLPWTGRLAVAA
jgi:hypothetical protein